MGEQSKAGLDPATAAALPLRRDIVALLEYIRDHKVIGTQAQGNLPLKAVREITARFVEPLALETTIGQHTFRIRSEENLWPLYFRRVLADVGGLLRGGRARTWRLTKAGERFLASEPTEQVCHLLATWWFRVNWLIAFPFAGMGQALPPGLNRTVLAHLHRLHVGEKVDFATFADRIIQETGLTWQARETTFARMALHGGLGRMVINVLVDFGAVEGEYADQPVGQGTIRKLVAFRLTPFGKGLLDSLRSQ